MRKRFEQIDKRFEQVDKRFDQMMTFIWIIAGIFTAITASTIGFAVWDRRTMMRFLKKSPEISDYIDYKTITRIRNALKNQENLCNPLLKSV